MIGRIFRRGHWVALAVVGLLGVGLFSATAQPEKVTVCHRTGSSVHPFAEIHPSVNGAWAHYSHHEDDAVAEFEYKGKTYSRLSTDTIAINENGECTLVSQPEEEEPPEVEPGDPIEDEPPFTG